ncbi:MULTISPECIES: DeoR/GlpR family DNA-binding transcription regulator [unclassified Kitasatospora]|uniref:DeoR/GlpR family DNA-binding transcription regulator n=1 Tax=unclassified Kitasatospora TaxID=2633591 RepID=UPI00070945E3|nr:MULTISPECIES: DeoR/GlpR family DNA-binding transcription regulator [unclassified Kitasatospora]KQV12408.1 alkaline phosphatase [Kitasatospora sp. Root107]KRB66910.1 alkaline phosphatase [Kitasatospora sp. Root187]
MLACDRQTWLLAILRDHGRLQAAEATERLGVSIATVRRDLQQLAQQGLLVRTRGGALTAGAGSDLALRFGSVSAAVRHRRIARAVAELVPPGSVVGLNGGAATREVARELAIRSGLSARSGRIALTVVTNAVHIAQELSARSHVRIAVTGGVAGPGHGELTGPLAVAMLREVALDFAILGVDAVDGRFGAEAHDESRAATSRAMAERAERVIVVAEAATLGRRAAAEVCPVGRISLLVTDRDAPDGMVDHLTAGGLDVLRASAGR